MNFNNRFLQSLVATVLMLAYMAVASATVVVFSVRGITDESQENAWGLEPGDFITAGGMFDDTVLTSGSGSVLLDQIGNSLTLSIGSVTYTALDDDAFGSGSPFLILGNNQLTELGFSTSLGGVDLGSVVNIVTGIDASDNRFMATWDFNTFTMSPVPVPAAVWLFGFGLIGLIGVARRKKS